MPRRSALTASQHAELFALPENEANLVRYWTLAAEDLRTITSRRRPHNRLGFALQLCALRYPGRLLKPGEFIPDVSLRFVGDQLGIEPDVLADYATRSPTRYEQLDTLREVFGFRQLSRPVKAEMQAFLLPIALTMTGGIDLARSLDGGISKTADNRARHHIAGAHGQQGPARCRAQSERTADRRFDLRTM